HRLDGEEHAGTQHDALARPADVHDVRLVMEQAADAVAAEVAHYAHVLGFDIGLDGGADIAGGRTRVDHGNAAHHRFVGHLDQALGAAWDRTHGEHAAGVAVPAVEDEGDVDIDDVALLERLLARDAVAHYVIDGGAGGLAIAAIHERRRHRPVRKGEIEH